MTGAARPGKLRRGVFAVLLAGCLSPLIAGQSLAASSDTRSPPPPARPAPPAPIIPAQTTVGICQCIADHDRRHIGCVSSVEACQSACASSRYSFVPNAPSCPFTAGAR